MSKQFTKITYVGAIPKDCGYNDEGLNMDKVMAGYRLYCNEAVNIEQAKLAVRRHAMFCNDVSPLLDTVKIELITPITIKKWYQTVIDVNGNRVNMPTTY